MNNKYIVDWRRVQFDLLGPLYAVNGKNRTQLFTSGFLEDSLVRFAKQLSGDTVEFWHDSELFEATPGAPCVVYIERLDFDRECMVRVCLGPRINEVFSEQLKNAWSLTPHMLESTVRIIYANLRSIFSDVDTWGLVASEKFRTYVSPMTVSGPPSLTAE